MNSKKSTKISIKIVSGLLALVLVISSIPFATGVAFAEDPNKIEVTFNVLDTIERPIDNAKVVLYADASLSTELDNDKTDSTGTVSLQVEEIDTYYYTVNADDMIEVRDSFIKTNPIVDVTMSYSAKCKECNGTGLVDCSNCSGTGEVNTETTCTTCAGSGLYSVTCPTCNGIDSDACVDCQGSGVKEISCVTCAGDGKVDSITTCPICSGNKKVVCTVCAGNKIVPADDTFEFKFESNPQLKYNSKEANPVTVDKSMGNIIYSSSDENVVKVDSVTGELTAIGDAGDMATITATIDYDKANGYAPKTAICTVAIVQTDFEASISANNLIYNGLQQDLVTVTDADKYSSVTYKIDDTSSDGKAKDAGDYSVEVTVVKDNNHKTYTTTVDVTINKATVTVVPDSNQTKYYGANIISNPITYTVANEQNNEKVITQGALSYENNEKEEVVGEKYKITKGDIALTTDEINKNYILEFDDSKTIEIIDFTTTSNATIKDIDSAAEGYWFNKEYMSTSTNGVTIVAPIGYKISTSNKRIINTWSDQIYVTTEGNHKDFEYYLKEDTVGGAITSKPLKVSFGIDVTLPTFDEAEFDLENDNILASIGRALTFGTFFNKQIEVSIESSDSLSGVNSVSLYLKDENDNKLDFSSSNNKNFKYENDIETITGTVYVTVVDKAGNVNNNNNGNELISTTKSNIIDEDSPLLMIENTKPELRGEESQELGFDINPTGNGKNTIYSQNGYKVFSNDISFEFTISDNDSGLYSTQISVNGEKLDKYQYSYTNTQTKKETYSVNTADFTADEYGKYTIVVDYSDAAGNSDTKTDTVYVDRHAPIVKSFEITGVVDGNGIKDDSAIPHAVDTTSYGFYFKKAAIVKVTFGDYTEPKELLSGIKVVQIYLVDKDNNTIYEITEEGKMNKINDISSVTTIPVSALTSVEGDTNDIKTFKFTVDKDFKGQIYAKAFDNVGNDLSKEAINSLGIKAPTNANEILGDALSYDDNGYQKPNGSIVETESNHNTVDENGNRLVSDVIITPTTKPVGKDTNGLDLYSGAVDIDLTVFDKYSGISTIDVQVVSDDDKVNEYSHTVSVNENANNDDALIYNGNPLENDWVITKYDENIATEMTNTITVINNSNNIVVKVTLTDRAGHTYSQEINFSIDNSKPEITVEYDKNDSTQYEKNAYYQDARTATITIKELNFTEEKVKDSKNNEYVINNDDIKNILITQKLDDVDQEVDSVFVKSKELVRDKDENGNTRSYYVYTKTVIFNPYGEGADCFFTMTATDNAKNKADYDREDNFIVDTNAPRIKVELTDDDKAVNGTYFSNKRTATITITDRYFDKNDSPVIISANDNGNEITAPSVSRWSTRNKDYEQSCIVTFEKDGTYSFTVDSTDLSGKKATQYKVSDFTIDNTDPTIKITINGKELKNGEKAAYIDEVVPKVEVEDTNFSAADTTVVLTPAVVKDNVSLLNEQKLISKNAEKENGMTYDYNNFKGEDGNRREYDNIYTLTVTTKDLSGRSIEPVSVMFSVNRYGSVYSNYEGANGKYFAEPPVIQVTETNVNAINFDDKNTYVEVISNSGNIQRLNSKDIIGQQMMEGTANNWYEYVYTIPSSCFNVDDIYSIKLSSVDTADRKSTNISDVNNDEIRFTVDTNDPYFEVTNYKDSDDSVKEEEFTLDLVINDDMSGIASYIVKFDGSIVERAEIEDGNYENSISIPVPVKGATKLSDAAGRKLEVELLDAAGRDNKTKEFNVRISTNFFVNALAKLQDFYHNTVAFWSTVTAVIMVAGALSWFIIAKKRKNNSNTAE